MLNRSGGDARAAFYMAAKEKGVDPDQFIEKLKGFGNLKGLASNVISSNPRAKMLFTLFSSMK